MHACASVQLVSAQRYVKQAVAAKDATLTAQEEQIVSLQEELNATKEELDVTRDGLNQATMELENVRILSAASRACTKLRLTSTHLFLYPTACAPVACACDVNMVWQQSATQSNLNSTR